MEISEQWFEEGEVASTEVEQLEGELEDEESLPDAYLRAEAADSDRLPLVVKLRSRLANGKTAAITMALGFYGFLRSVHGHFARSPRT